MMTIPRFAVFAVLLFILRNAGSALVILMLSEEEPMTSIVAQKIVGAVVNICVFVYMTWAYPAQPVLYASMVGVIAYMLGVLATALVAGFVLWDPVGLAFDALTLMVTVSVGVGLGSIFRRRGKSS